MAGFWRLLLVLAALLAPAAVWAEPPRRVLHVSLYPYIPEAQAAALTLKQGFEATHPNVIVDITFNRNYYDPSPAAKGVLYEDADVHEIDVVFLRDFIRQHKLAPLPPAFLASVDKLEPLAAKAASPDGTVVAIPQWMCSDFLIFRTDKTHLGDRPTLAELEQSLGPDHGLLMDMAGGGTMGEYYLSALLGEYGDPDVAIAHITPTPDPVIVDRLRRILALEPAGYGRNAGYHAREDFYARQFARGAGDAFFGYSELTHDALDESAVSCRDEDHCVTAADIQVAAFPFEDGKVRPAAFIDMFGIDAKVHGRKLADAEAFIRFAVSLPAYRALLIPEPGAIPRYLLPATQAAFEDPQILKAAPLYPKFRAIIDQGVVVSARDLNARLRSLATVIDTQLPATH